MNFVKGLDVRRRFSVDQNGVRTRFLGCLDQTGRRIDVPGTADHEENIALKDGIVNHLHSERHLAEPNHVGTHTLGRRTAVAERKIITKRSIVHAMFATAADLATEREQLPVHVVDLLAAATFVKVVDVLRDEHRRLLFSLKPCKGDVGRVWLNLVHLATAFLVKSPDLLRVCRPTFGSRHLLYPMVFPQSVVVSERPNTRFCRYACAGQHHNSLLVHRRSRAVRVFQVKSRSCSAVFHKIGWDGDLQFGHTKKPRRAESLKNLDKAFGVERFVQLLVPGVDSDRFKTDEFRRRRHAQDVVLPDAPQNIR